MEIVKKVDFQHIPNNYTSLDVVDKKDDMKETQKPSKRRKSGKKSRK